MKREYVFVQDEDRFYERVYVEDIYYIEEIKSTHYCKVIYKTGEGIVRADIKHLEGNLGATLYKVKASTLINLKHVWRIYMDKRLIYFTKDIYCTFSAKNSRRIKEELRVNFVAGHC